MVDVEKYQADTRQNPGVMIGRWEMSDFVTFIQVLDNKRDGPTDLIEPRKAEIFIKSDKVD